MGEFTERGVTGGGWVQGFAPSNRNKFGPSAVYIALRHALDYR